MKYFVFNKALDYQRGKGSNIAFDNTGIWIKEPLGGLPGVFLSRIMDAGEQGTVWHRMKAVTEAGNNMAIFIKLYGTDSLEAARQAWSDPEASKGFLQLERKDPEDALLWEIKARYLWLSVTLWGDGEKSPKLCFLQLYFPKQSWAKYLPEVYQGRGAQNPFLERYLAVFQTMYEEMEENIRGEAGLLDLPASKGGAFQWLTGFLGLERSYGFETNRLKAYLSQGAECFKRRGTRRGIVELVKAYTGGPAWLGEWENQDLPGRINLYVPEQSAASMENYQSLLKLVREHMPVDMELRIVILRPYVRLGRHTYLGINSRLNTYKQAALDGLSMVNMSIVGGRK